jgi:hypothetical protein
MTYLALLYCISFIAMVSLRKGKGIKDGVNTLTEAV